MLAKVNDHVKRMKKSDYNALLRYYKLFSNAKQKKTLN